MPRLVLAVCLLLANFVTHASPATGEAAHQELRALLTGIEDAINKGEYRGLEPYFHKDMMVTTINQEILSSPGEIGAYFDKWFGPGGYLHSLRMKLTADAPTRFYAGGNIGVVRGSGAEDYVLADGRSFEMKTRWTATVIRDDDGKWRILALHIGTNFLDNPILAVAERSLLAAAIAGLITGVILMLIAGWFLRMRRMRRRAEG